jgi:hypothetical protein
MLIGPLFAGSAMADTTLQFDKGKFAKTVHGSVLRGSREKFWVGAGKGQKIKVTITSLEDNAVFRVVGDGGSLSPEEQTHWSGTLPVKGEYLIEVGPTRGNATFDLTVEIR